MEAYTMIGSIFQLRPVQPRTLIVISPPSTYCNGETAVKHHLAALSPSPPQWRCIIDRRLCPGLLKAPIITLHQCRSFLAMHHHMAASILAPPLTGLGRLTMVPHKGVRVIRIDLDGDPHFQCPTTQIPLIVERSSGSSFKKKRKKKKSKFEMGFQGPAM